MLADFSQEIEYVKANQRLARPGGISLSSPSVLADFLRFRSGLWVVDFIKNVAYVRLALQVYILPFFDVGFVSFFRDCDT